MAVWAILRLWDYYLLTFWGPGRLQGLGFWGRTCTCRKVNLNVLIFRNNVWRGTVLLPCAQCKEISAKKNKNMVSKHCKKPGTGKTLESLLAVG